MGLLDMLMGGGQGAAPAGDGLSDRLSNPLSQIGLAMMAASGGPKVGFAAPIAQGLANAGKLQKQNRTLEYLRQNNPEIAQMVDAGLDPGEAFNLAMKRQADQREQARFDANMKFQQGKFDYEQRHDADEFGYRRDALAAANTTDDIKEFNYAIKNGYSGTFSDWQTKKATGAAGAGGYGLDPIYGTLPDGTIGIGQMGKDGTIVRSKTPEGFTPMTPFETNYGKAKGTAEGKARGEENAGYDSAASTAGMVADQIAAIASDPALPNVLGGFDSRTPIFREDSARVQSKIDQLQGGAFLEARKMLKGGGQITDYEGRKAEAAMVRLNQNQSPEDFKAALKDFNDAVQEGFRKLAARTGKGASAPDPSADGGMKSKYGLD